MGLYKKIMPTHGGIKRNNTSEGMPVERMWAALKDNKSVGNIEGKEMMYPQEGIPYGTDIRGNKWDQAITQTDKVTKAITAARDRKAKKAEEKREAQIKENAARRATESKQGNEQSSGGTATSE